MKFLMSLLACFLFQNAIEAQNTIYTDPRDGQEYEVVLVDSTYWFSGNLRYESLGAHCPHSIKGNKNCSGGNYYPYSEVDTICPSFWRAAKQADWEAYFYFMLNERGIQHPVRDTLYGKDWYASLEDTSKTLLLFDTTNLLDLSGLGWIQGKRWRNIGTNTQWAKGTENEDPKFHIHIGENGAVKHSHDHNIIDKPRKVRKFMVKCVCEEKEFKKNIPDK